VNRLNFTKAKLDALPLPKPGTRVVYHDADGPHSVRGLQVRITANGTKTFVVFKRVNGGRPERVTLGRYPDMSIAQARQKAIRVIADLADGNSINARKREVRQKARSLTLAEALQEYVEQKRRRKDGLPLKERTRRDYLKMVAPGRQRADGTKNADGELYKLAGKPIRQITAEDIRAVHRAALARGERRAAYAMQVLRAVLNWHGVEVADSPFDRHTPEKLRVNIPQSRPAGRSIPPERIGDWWRAVNDLPTTPTVDYLRFLLLTGCRPSEPLKVTVRDCDLLGGRVTIRDTKNRRDHVVALSEPALAIVKRQIQDKPADAPLFSVRNPRKTVQAITAATGIEFAPKDLRATFASIAEVLTSAYTLKRMMNHTQAGDVTGLHYVHKGESQLRAGWQAVADWIQEQAAENVVVLQQEPGA